MLLRFTLAFVSSLLFFSGFSQASDLFYNNGDQVYLQSGAILHIQGGLTNKNVGSGAKNITSAAGAIIQVEGNINIEASTTFTDNGVLRMIGGSVMPGTGTDQTLFTGANQINNLVIDRETAGDGVRLLSDVEVKGSLVWGSKTAGSATFTAYTGTTDQVRAANRSNGYGLIRTYNGATDYDLYVSNGAATAVVGYQAPPTPTASDATQDKYVENRGVKGVGLGGFSRSVTSTSADYYFPVGTSTNTYQAIKMNFDVIAAAPNKIRGLFVDNASGFGTITKTLDCANSDFSGMPAAPTCNAGTYTLNNQFVLDNNGYNIYGPDPCRSVASPGGWYIFDATPTNHGFWSFTGGSANRYIIEGYPTSFTYSGSLTNGGARLIKHGTAITSDPTGDDWTGEILTACRGGIGDLFKYSKWPVSSGGNTNTCASTSNVTGIPGGQYTGFSHFGFGGAGSADNPLPVELLYLRAMPVNNSFIRLNFATATEINNKGFEIMRSEDGATFKKIGWTEGHGNSATTIQYAYDDKTVEFNKSYYYKLNQIDIDGHAKESYTVTAKITDGPDFTVGEFQPNPTIGKTKLVINTSGTESIEVKFYNMLGAEVMRHDFQLVAGTNELNFDSDQLADATYNAIIRVGNTFYSKKLVVSKY